MFSRELNVDKNAVNDCLWHDKLFLGTLLVFIFPVNDCLLYCPCQQMSLVYIFIFRGGLCFSFCRFHGFFHLQFNMFDIMRVIVVLRLLFVPTRIPLPCWPRTLYCSKFKIGRRNDTVCSNIFFPFVIGLFLFWHFSENILMLFYLVQITFWWWYERGIIYDVVNYLA